MSEYNFYTITVPAEFLEQMGTKEKYWFHFSEEDSFWLFKYSRIGTGEHWSEKVAEKICQELGIPHARYELANTNGRPGVITKNIIPRIVRLDLLWAMRFSIQQALDFTLNQES